MAKVCGNGDPCVVFLSETPFFGNVLGGLNGADALCQLEATASGSLAPPGVYKAWLSYGTDSPQTRFVHSPGPYVLVTGTVVAASFAVLTGGELLRAIDRTQLGTRTGSRVWTNTTPQGLPTNPGDEFSCTGWSLGGEPDVLGGFGDSRRAIATWTQESGGFLCAATLARLYCFQQS